MDHKKSTENALNRFFERQLETEKKPTRRKNKSPERVVVKEVTRWMTAKGWSWDVAEASTYDRINKGFSEARLPAGFSDIVACAPLGVACYAEIKAPGKRSTLRGAQRVFLVQKIKVGAFAGVFDSVQGLDEAYQEYTRLKLAGLDTANFLLELLPKKRTTPGRRSHPELGF